MRRNEPLKKLHSFFVTASVLGSGSLSGSSYALFIQPQTWDNAEAHCKTLGAHLIKIDSEAENDFIKSTFLTSDGLVYWIGMSNRVQEGTWVLVADGSMLGSFSNWKSSQPSHNYGNQHCAAIIKSSGLFSIGPPYYRSYLLNYRDAVWNDLECYFPFGFICEKSSWNRQTVYIVYVTVKTNIGTFDGAAKPRNPKGFIKAWQFRLIYSNFFDF